MKNFLRILYIKSFYNELKRSAPIKKEIIQYTHLMKDNPMTIFTDSTCYQLKKFVYQYNKYQLIQFRLRTEHASVRAALPC